VKMRFLRRQGGVRHSRGFTTIELLVASMVGLLLIAATTQIFVSNKQVYRLTDSLSRVQENGRFALEIMARDARMAGYKGCLGDLEYEVLDRTTIPPNDVPVITAGMVRNTLNDITNYIFDFSKAIQGFDADGSTWAPAPGTLFTDMGIDPVAGTDVITFRGIEGGGVEVVDHPGGTPPGSADIKVREDSGIAIGDILLVSDCYAGGIFQVTNLSTSSAQDNVVHNTGTGDDPGNWTKGLGKDFTGGEVYKLSTRTYYIGTSAITNRPSLWRKVGAGASDELVEGVEDMQILYGQDTNGDQIVDLYEPADDVADWTEVVAVRIALLVAGQEDNVTVENQTVTFNNASSTATDRRIRQAFTTTVAVRNKLP